MRATASFKFRNDAATAIVFDSDIPATRDAIGNKSASVVALTPVLIKINPLFAEPFLPYSAHVCFTISAIRDRAEAAA